MMANQKAKLRDLAAALPVACWFGLVAWASLVEIANAAAWRQAPLDRVVQLANAIFAIVLIILLIARLAPVARAHDMRALAAGVGGGFAPLAMIALPHATPAPEVLLISIS